MIISKCASFGPDDVHTRHSEGDFLRMKDGSILFAYSRFTGGGDDDAASHIACCRSYDDGRTWSRPEKLFGPERYGVRNIMSVSLMRMANGDAGLFYLVKETPEINRVMLSRSRDEFGTFYSHTECSIPDRPGYYIMNNCRTERLESGRIIIPLALHHGGYSPASGRYFDGRAECCFIYSDDDGMTWRESADRVYPPFTGTNTGLQEPGIIELGRGVLWGYARTDHMYQYGFYSMDNGEHWTPAAPTRFTSPNSPMKLVRSPKTGDIYAVWNPVPDYNGRVKEGVSWGRTPLVIAVSRDNGASWSEQETIAAEPGHGYCYPAVFFTDDGALLVAFCAGGPADTSPLCRLDICRININC